MKVFSRVLIVNLTKNSLDKKLYKFNNELIFQLYYTSITITIFNTNTAKQ